MDERVWQQVEDVLGRGVPMVVATTGGGSQLVEWLLNHPGASRSVLEVRIPYSAAALADYLGGPGPHRADEETARAMAARAHLGARRLSGEGSSVVGLGCTAALATRRRRQGSDRAHLALRGNDRYLLASLAFARDAADRLAQEEVLSRWGLRALCETVGVDPGPEPAWPAWCQVARHRVAVAEPLEQLLLGELDAIEVGIDGSWSPASADAGRLILSGSFDPLHAGHEELLAAAEAQTGRPAWLELSVENVDKPRLSYAEVQRRVEPLRGRYRVLVSGAAIFARKARLFPGATFVVGFDTAARLLDGRYYEGGVAGRDQALAELAASGARFLVAGRLVAGGYRVLADLVVPAAHRPMFAAIPEAAFRRDISSTELRRRPGPAPDG